ncbi:proline-rich receptor-like protein kinase PERK2 [Iris pallida]|uniref:Proline-rich receptor-like protein kinase PERK2 n=1 Tax=Iris pallida TaxID=29817 RepID=A0AAX6G1D7_IRIPA|nr:proline-rich receptor-like protein kinase PERK2 [Iris pallida]
MAGRRAHRAVEGPPEAGGGFARTGGGDRRLARRSGVSEVRGDGRWRGSELELWGSPVRRWLGRGATERSTAVLRRSHHGVIRGFALGGAAGGQHSAGRRSAGEGELAVARVPVRGTTRARLGRWSGSTSRGAGGWSRGFGWVAAHREEEARWRRSCRC